MADEVTHRVRSGSAQVVVNWPVILFLAAQTGAGVWWASGVTKSVDFISLQLAQQLADSRRELAETKAELKGEIDMLRRQEETDRVYIQDIREKFAGGLHPSSRSPR